VRIWSALDGKPVMPPLLLSGMGWTIDWAGTSAVVAGKGPTLAVIDLANLSRWTDRSVANVVGLSELVAGRRVEAGGETPLTAAEWLDRYRSARTAIPDAFALRFGPAEPARVVADKPDTPSFRDELARHWRSVPMPRGGTGRESISDSAARGEQKALAGDWPMAARYFLYDVRSNPGNTLSAIKLAHLLVDNGVLDVYRRLCELELQQFASTQDPLTAYRIARLCLLTPDAAIDRDAVRRLADLAVAQGKGHPLEPMFLMTRGLLAFRDGEFDEAIEWSQRASEGVDKSRYDVQLPCAVVAALAKRQSGREAEAAEELALAHVLAAEHLSLDPDQPAIGLYPNSLLCRALLREAGLEPQEPDDPQDLRSRGYVHLFMGDNRGAAQFLRRCVDLIPDDQLLACSTTLLLAQLGDAEGVAEMRRFLMNRWGQTADPTTAERTAKSYLIPPEPGADQARACELADLSVERGAGHQYEKFFWHVKALAEYRRGNDAESFNWSQRVNQAGLAANLPLTLASRLLTVMALHRMGRSDEARQELERVRRITGDQVLLESLPGTAIWHADDLWWMALETEATALIEGSTPATEQPGTGATESRAPE
jgi:tetratricopeptide (TPR) repeat protein